MQAHHIDLCTYLDGIECASTEEEVEIDIETKVTLRQESHENR